MKSLVQLLAAVCVLAAASACTTEDPTTQTNIPLVPTQPLVDTFSGTVPVGAGDTKVFSVTQGNGELDITLATTSQAGVVLAIGAGTWDGVSCTLASGATRNVTAGPSPQLQFLQVAVGNYCVQTFDPGTPAPLAAPVQYTIAVAHY
ncbi:MAG TPA: hypothetical protein VFB07_00315 [Vicinamibacterales bacterium]|nr:hypothetical protein [Vicinamibacterales bacterium]